MHSKFQRIVMLCPDLHEVGGIGAVSRMSLTALCSQVGAGEVWSLGAPSQNHEVRHPASWSVRYANGNKAQFAWWALQSGLRNSKDQLVVAMHLQLAPIALPFLARGAQLAVFLHGSECWVPLRSLQAKALECADVLMANSRFTVERFKSVNRRFAPAIIAVCPLGVPCAGLEDCSVSHHPPFALIVSRIVAEERHKGHDALLEVWPRVQREVPEARLVVAGDGNDRLRLENKARDLGLDGAVSFIGRVSDAELRQLYQEAAFYVMPSSRLEGFGLAFLEAMRAGKPCIGGAGAAEEVIVDQHTGFIVSERDGETLERAIVRLFCDGELRTRMGRAGLERYCQQFTEEHFRDRLLGAIGLLAGA
jgi:phosphatidylinositol alpha-1,6-mannosyltransferase